MPSLPVRLVNVKTQTSFLGHAPRLVLLHLQRSTLAVKCDPVAIDFWEEKIMRSHISSTNAKPSNAPATTGNPSGKGRGNAPPKGGKK
jgi:hypothetical protein